MRNLNGRSLCVGLCLFAFAAMPLAAQKGGPGAGGGGNTNPTVTAVSPSSGDVAGGVTVTLTGTNFTGATSVTFGVGTNPLGTATNLTVVNATTITCTVPAQTANGPASVQVTNGSGKNPPNTAFTYTGTDFAPIVTSINPLAGPVTAGTPVTIIGTTLTGATAVTIGGNPVTNLVVVNSTTITALAPAGTAGVASVNVTTPNGTNAVNTLYTYLAAGSTIGVPLVNANGVVPIFSTSTTIEPGEWVSIYGNNLAPATAVWSGNFPTTLGGTSVTIDGHSAYLWFVSPNQINLQVPNDTNTGSVSIVVTTLGGTASSQATLAAYAPSVLLQSDGKHANGIILRSNGSGAYGNGSYDIIGPTGSSLGYATVAAKAGDTIELYAVGLGATTPALNAGQNFAGQAPTNSPVTVLINNVSVTPTYAGLAGAGYYQLNVTIPSGLGTGDVPLVVTVGGVQSQNNVVLSLQ